VPGAGAALALAGACMALSIANPARLILVPAALVLLALPPLQPARALLGAAGALLLVVGGPHTTAADFERGWSLLLGGWFIAVCALASRSGGEPRFLSRGLVTVAGAAASAALLFWFRGGLFERVDSAVRLNLADSGEAFLKLVGGTRADPRLADAFREVTAVQGLIYPALLAVSSLAALGVAWWVWGRVAGRETGLRPLREFRFADGLVWVLIGGLLLMLLPLSPIADRAGSNLLAFMGLLYALRGLAVMVVVGSGISWVGVVLAVLLLVLLYPLVMAATFIVGLSDTWLDIRTRREAMAPPRT
jgi:hypothetical protein